MSDLAASRMGMRWLIVTLAAGALLIAVVAAGLVYMGSFDVAADKPHSQPVFWLMDTVRERSVAVRAAGIAVPGDLADAKRIASGAAQYDEMCSLCHLAPGMKRTEISRGLYPRAPELRRKSELTPAEQFWVVKHGLKMTGMPAWGVTHDDELLWDVVAFLRKLPDLTAEQYQTLVKSAPKSHDEMMHEMMMDDGHGHDDQPKQ
ncbi:MAG TPA: cytochrome c [Methyloceanibacter sp.]|jgi:mono/diheme cytochrome c family protein